MTEFTEELVNRVGFNKEADGSYFSDPCRVVVQFTEGKMVLSITLANGFTMDLTTHPNEPSPPRETKELH